MKKLFWILVISLVASTAVAQSCVERLTPQFTGHQAGKMCASDWALDNDVAIKMQDSSGATQEVLRIETDDDTILCAPGGDAIEMGPNNCTQTWEFSPGGDFAQRAAGGNILMTQNLTSLALPAATGVSAAGSAITDATDLTDVFTNVTTVASSTGVQLYNPSGVGGFLVVRNSGANALTVYPDSASATINGGSAGAGITCATTEVCFFVEVAASTWIAGVMVAP